MHLLYIYIFQCRSTPGWTLGKLLSLTRSPCRDSMGTEASILVYLIDRSITKQKIAGLYIFNAFLPHFKILINVFICMPGAEVPWPELDLYAHNESVPRYYLFGQFLEVWMLTGWNNAMHKTEAVGNQEFVGDQMLVVIAIDWGDNICAIYLDLRKHLA